MEQFRKTLKRRLTFASLYNALVLLCLTAGYAVARRFALPDIAVGFTCGVMVGLQMVMIYFMSKIHRALKDEEKLQALCIEENDERSRFIEAKIGGSGVSIILGGLLLGTVVSCYFDQTVFFTLLGALFFCLLVRGTLKIYYRSKI